ncbi:hypothetical protein AVEN_187293-1 [Araneus ventricosus]|uniref:Uncharacterized protein n=1 Tax=Araneus ventricosus TaxID=182803 RepID=A0A4Y2U0B4_ARAVE|nr:hypothetical protein AVEN_187293-1 [Araneus ventricosus]
MVSTRPHQIRQEKVFRNLYCSYAVLEFQAVIGSDILEQALLASIEKTFYFCIMKKNKVWFMHTQVCRKTGGDQELGSAYLPVTDERTFWADRL